MKKIFLLAIVLGLVGCEGGGGTVQKEVAAKEVVASDVASISPKTQIVVDTPSTKSEWIYDQKVDEMRGITSKYASILSSNRVQFDFPYDGGSRLDITLRKRSVESADVMFTIVRGQYSCDTISDNCFASIKFDNSDIETVELSGTTDHASDVLFISNISDINSFIKSLLGSKSLIIELPFYQEGKKQFTFDVSGLIWE